MKESRARREKRQPIPKRVSGDGSAAAALSIRFCSVCPFGRALGFGARERSERVTVRRQPHRQLCRRLVYKPSARITAISIKPLKIISEYLVKTPKKWYNTVATQLNILPWKYTLR